jgi:hypothetical protein
MRATGGGVAVCMDVYVGSGAGLSVIAPVLTLGGEGLAL